MPSISHLVSLEEGTCSARATEAWRRKFSGRFDPSTAVERHPIFERAVDALKRTPDTACLLLPHLHNMCRTLSYDPDLEIADEFSFWVPNPKLYLAKGPALSILCASIPTLQNLVSAEASRLKLVFDDADNTQAAARQAARGNCGYAVTNAHGVETYGLEPITELKHMKVFWIAFVHRTES